MNLLDFVYVWLLLGFCLYDCAAESFECGLSNYVPGSERIINGTLSKRGEFPWVAWINFTDGIPYYGCVGSVISPYHVLTAAHCGAEVGNNITFGVANLDDKEAVIVSAKNVYPHPNATHGYINDIAIIELSEELHFNGFIRPICLKKSFVETPADEGIISGFGAKFWFAKDHLPPPEAYDGKLRKGKTRFVVHEDCVSQYNRSGSHSKIVKEVHICALGENEMDVYDGDSGSPLIIRNVTRKDGKVQYTQVGLTCFGPVNDFQPRPAVFTRVSTFCDWIAETTKNLAKCND
ncbi:trypsin domain-containing protein [Ditylenchus destructor]|uniref:Trypsin domain-containing protein n=1 Tax=Ditylenchus destructor TaxID=166010 RepID=A0AAD4MWT8_9BILA|nr:trypsin domain-containing protein [Ditylenchus destructor]